VKTYSGVFIAKINKKGKINSIIARSSNGRTPAFGAGYLGSNPSLATNLFCSRFEGLKFFIDFTVSN
jgi:hypothetical protein